MNNLIPVIRGLLRSKTFWFHILYTAVVLAGLFGYTEFQPNPEIALLVQAIAGIVLRIVTKESLKEKVK